MKKLYEFSALIQVNIIVAAESEKEARKEIELLGADGWLANGDKLDEVIDISMDDIRGTEGIIDLDDVAHLIT